MFMKPNKVRVEASGSSRFMLSKPVTFMFCELSTDLIGVNQLTAFGSGIPLFDLGTSVGQPFLVLVKQLQSPLDYFAGIVIRARAQHLQGAVRDDQFYRLAEGQHPVTGEQLVRHRMASEYKNQQGQTVQTAEHRAGWGQVNQHTARVCTEREGISIPRGSALAAKVKNRVLESWLR